MENKKISIKDLYNWAVENGVEDYALVNYYSVNGKENYKINDFEIDKAEKEVYSFFEN